MITPEDHTKRAAKRHPLIDLFLCWGCHIAVQLH